MNAKVWMAAAVASSIGLTALAHAGATGVMKERMDAMGEMGKEMKRLALMMRGQIDYDAAVVRSAADTMIRHAGTQMTDLFPKGSNGKPSEALDAIWDDWEDFVALADALRTSAEGMKLAADNGLAASGGAVVGSGQTMMGGSQAMMGGGQAQITTPDMYAEMPVNAAFMAVTQTCSACHQKYRAKDK